MYVIHAVHIKLKWTTHLPFPLSPTQGNRPLLWQTQCYANPFLKQPSKSVDNPPGLYVSVIFFFYFCLWLCLRLFFPYHSLAFSLFYLLSLFFVFFGSIYLSLSLSLRLLSHAHTHSRNNLILIYAWSRISSASRQYFICISMQMNNNLMAEHGKHELPLISAKAMHIWGRVCAKEKQNLSYFVYCFSFFFVHLWRGKETYFLAVG